MNKEEPVLEQYYNEVFKTESDLEFDKLTKEQVNVLNKSLGFARYKLQIAGEKFVNEARKKLTFNTSTHILRPYRSDKD